VDAPVSVAEEVEVADLEAVAVDSEAVAEEVEGEVAAVAKVTAMEDHMNNGIRSHILGRRLATLFSLAALVAAFTLAAVHQVAAQQPSQRTFDSPGKAVLAMIRSLQTGDTNELMQIFGPQGREVLFSGDPVADKNNREQVVRKFQEMRRVVVEPDKTVTLYIGAENWPFPIPLVNTKGAWYFDTAAGKQEILFRRIGRNETDSIDTLQSLVDAQKEYEGQPRDADNVRQFAQKFQSDEGKHDGLFWKSAPGRPLSPIGPLIAGAAKEGYKKRANGPTPFHGYIYRFLLRQGKDAPGGAMDYMTNGRLTRGFAFVAYPAEYRNSGVMTFIVGKDGTVYQKDMGSRTASIAAAMTEYNPDKSWQPSE